MFFLSPLLGLFNKDFESQAGSWGRQTSAKTHKCMGSVWFLIALFGRYSVAVVCVGGRVNGFFNKSCVSITSVCPDLSCILVESAVVYPAMCSYFVLFCLSVFYCTLVFFRSLFQYAFCFTYIRCFAVVTVSFVYNVVLFPWWEGIFGFGKKFAEG